MSMEFPRRVILGKGQDWRDVPYVDLLASVPAERKS